MVRLGRMKIDTRLKTQLVMFAVILLVVDFVQVAAAESQTEFCQKYLKSQFYTCKEYTIQSADGYYLLLHRIRAARVSNASLDDIRPSAVVIEHFDLQAGGPASVLPASAPLETLADSDAALSPSASTTELPPPPQAAEPPTSTLLETVITQQKPNTSTADPQFLNPLGGSGIVAISPEATPDSEPLSSTSAAPIESTTSKLPLNGGDGPPQSADISALGAPVLAPPVSPEQVDVPIQAPSSPLSTQIQTKAKSKGDAVLLVHAEMQNGGSWFISIDENETVLPYVLADDGFDVWIAHERATYWSHGHAYLKVDDPAYWNWTWDQHAQYDVPRMLQFVNSKSCSKVHYIGVSQSATVGAAAATKPEASSLIQSLTLIGPTIYRGSTSSILMRAWAGFFGNLMNGSAYGSGGGLFNFSREFRVQSLPLRGKPISTLLPSISGPDCCLSPATIVAENGWDGTTSFKNLLHVRQGIVTNTFQQFDYGSVTRNMEAYGGRINPPPYEPEMIPPSIPVQIIYGGQDFYAPSRGIMDFAGLLIRKPTLVFLPFYAHFDLFYSTRRFHDVFTPVKSFLQHHPIIRGKADIPPPNSTLSTPTLMPDQPLGEPHTAEPTSAVVPCSNSSPFLPSGPNAINRDSDVPTFPSTCMPMPVPYPTFRRPLGPHSKHKVPFNPTSPSNSMPDPTHRFLPDYIPRPLLEPSPTVADMSPADPSSLPSTPSHPVPALVSNSAITQP